MEEMEKLLGITPADHDDHDDQRDPSNLTADNDEVEVIKASPTQSVKKKNKKTRRSSVVQVAQDDGSKYYYDDPSLGGTGATAWAREDLEVLKEGEEEGEGSGGSCRDGGGGCGGRERERERKCRRRCRRREASRAGAGVLDVGGARPQARRGLGQRRRRGVG